ncbi:MAG: arginase family protein [Pseudomonadota bacterium]
MSDASPGRILVRNAGLEILPRAGGGVTLRLPHWRRSIDATRYQVQLLQHFIDGADPVQVLERFPFARHDTTKFLQDCVEHGVLVERDAQGREFYPERVRPLVTALGAPFVEDAIAAPFVFLGVPWDGGTSGRPGARFGPAVLREAVSSCQLQLDAVDLLPMGFYDFGAGRALLERVLLADAGDVFAQPGEEAAEVHARVTRQVRRIVQAGAIPLVLGGDHSISYPVLRGFEGKRIGLLHLDAHTDLDEPHPRDVLHHGSVMTWVHEHLPDVARILQVGLRGITNLGAQGMPERVQQVGMDLLRREGPAAVLDHLPENLVYYVSIDIDVVDPSCAPATGTPVPGGLWPHEVKQLLREVGEQRVVVGADLVEVTAPGEMGDGTAMVGMELMLTLADAVVQGERRRAAATAT